MLLCVLSRKKHTRRNSSSTKYSHEVVKIRRLRLQRIAGSHLCTGEEPAVLVLIQSDGFTPDFPCMMAGH